MNEEKNYPVIGGRSIDEEIQKARMEALTQFNSISSKKAKVVEIPYFWRTQSAFDIARRDYTVDDIHRAKNSKNAVLMRRISNFFYTTSSSYRRILDTFANIFKYYYTLDIQNIASVGGNKNGKKKVLQLYSDTLRYLDNFEIESTFAAIASKMLVDGAFYGYVTDFGKQGQVITMLDPNYSRTRFKSPYGTNLVEFDVTFFSTYTAEEREAAFKVMPSVIRETWNNYVDKGTDYQLRWAVLPAEESCAFTFGDSDFPPFFDDIIDIINFDEYKELEKARDMQVLEKILIQRFGLDDNNNLELLLPEIQKLHEGIANMLADNPSIDVLTSLADSIDLKDVQTNTGTVTNNNIQKMMVPKYENVGLSSELYYSTTATALEMSMMNATSFMNPTIVNFSVWLSVMCLSKFNYGEMKPIVTIIPLTWYNDKRLSDQYLKLAQMGYDKVLPYVSMGKRQSTLLDNAILQNDILDLNSVLIPLQSSFTQSPNATGTGSGARQKGDPQQNDDGTPKQRGRPAKAPEERAEKTNRNLASMNYEEEDEDGRDYYVNAD